MTGVESQHERECIIRRIKGIFTSWPESSCHFLRNAASTVCIAKLSCVPWAREQSGYGTVGQSARCGAKSACWQKCMLAGICSYVHYFYHTTVSLLGVSVSSCLGKTLILPHFRLAQQYWRISVAKIWSVDISHRISWGLGAMRAKPFCCLASFEISQSTCASFLSTAVQEYILWQFSYC